MARYRPVDAGVDFPALERDVLEFWRRADVFRKSLAARQGAPEWVFYEGPPTANGKPGIHHVESRTFKDLYPRFKTMTGHHVHRKGGWDCHGLPVELEVEKEIGTRTKRDIEAFGIGEFNRLCRESVTRYVDDWERLTERIGFWIDLSDAYLTMEPRYVESVWWSLKALFREGLLYESDRVTAYCPRCGTALSDHEVALGYTQVRDPSVFVRFPVEDDADPALRDAALLVWTTTPWTLISNTGVAVSPDERYAVVDAAGQRLVLAERLVRAVLGEDASVTATVAGSDLEGLRYRAPFRNVEGDVHRVVAAPWVATNEGTGIVHLAPAFGAEDLEVGRAEGWPVFKPIDDQGRFTDLTPVEFVRGRFFKEADPEIVRDLEARGLLLRHETYEHTYPLCWRCDTPLLYYARRSWYIRTTARRERLLAVNESVNWYPEHVKHGRYGDWLENNVDWALSRERYWGTPLPLWRCVRGHVTPVGSLAELSQLAGRDVTAVDPHRPAIDEVALACPDCGQEARRVPEVIDTWYDSGAMPFAQWGYHPELGRGIEEFERRFPADFISEGIDQTRGWFYSLMAEATLLFDATAYRNCVVLGLLLDAAGRKMSKRLGNVVDPSEVIDRHGADALRWFLITGGSPWSARRVSMEAFEGVVRQFLLTLWNVHAFYVTYANADDVDPAAGDVPVADRPVLDRWILSRLSATVAEAGERLEAYDATGAGRQIERFVDDLSNWYVRRARRRFWDPAGQDGDGPAKAAAYLTLEQCLTTVARLLAPFTPFVAEALWRNLAAARPGAPESVHLADYPEADAAARDRALEEAMAAARSVVALGRTVRNEAGIKVRQPLRRAVVHLPGEAEGAEALLDLVAEELNVASVEVASSAEELAGWRAKPNFRALGPRLGAGVKDVARALEADDGTLAAALADGQRVTVATGHGDVELGPDEVELTRDTASGWGMASQGGTTVGLDLEVTPELRREGQARDLLRLVQDARKAAGLDVSDRIELAVAAEGQLRRALDEHREWLAAEALALSLSEEPPDWPDAHRTTAELDGAAVAIALRRAG
ncbi:MAG TPA: isoleucine--tRNA ligase [Actinomycetota bacterium]|nr:isoleucine--tRNA ligase [Actinomycetota bacterium]